MADQGKIQRCGRCRVELSPDAKHCPYCGIPVGSGIGKPSARRLWPRTLLYVVALSSFIAVIGLPHIAPWIRSQWLLQTSHLIYEAVGRANDNPRAAAILGKPITARWWVRGYLRDDETGWRDGRLWIPVSGSQRSGTLYARVGRASGPWVFSELELSTENGTVVNLLEPPPPSPVRLQACGPVYLIPLGNVGGLGLEELPDYYRKTYGLEVTLLPSIRVPVSGRDSVRMHFVAEDLVDLMKRRHPKLAKDDSAVLIGIINQDMSIRSFNWPSAYTYRTGGQFAVVSGAFLKPSPYNLPQESSWLKTRVRKVVSRDIGFLVYRLPYSNDPTSLLYSEMWSVRDIDLASERFDGLGSVAAVSEFKDAHGQAPVKPELRADVSQPLKADGRHPCLIVQWPDNAQSNKITAEITKCSPRSLIETEVNEIEVDLRYGLLLARKTDLFIPDAIPLTLTRCYRLWDHRPLPFGASTNHVWDMNPTGSRQPYTYVDLALCDGQSIHYERISKGSGYADAVYEHRETATPFLGSRFSWNGKGWDLRLKDGSLLLFPEAYHAKRPVEGAIIGFRDAEGRSVQVDRDRHRNLQRITSPSGHFIAFEQDPSGKILKAFDDRQRAVKYVYDDAGRLALVQGLNSVHRHWYDGTYLTAIDDGNHRLVNLRYFEGRLAELSLPDGRSYRLRFEYDPRDHRQVLRSFTIGPDGMVIRTDARLGTN